MTNSAKNRRFDLSSYLSQRGPPQPIAQVIEPVLEKSKTPKRLRARKGSSSVTELSTRSRSRKEGSTIANSRAVVIKKEPSKPELDELLPSEEKMLIESLQYRV